MNYLKGAVIAALVLLVLLGGSAVALLKFGPGSERDIKRQVEYDLIDPTSALFRDIVLGDFYACGYVNAKNRMGGYIGWQRFTLYRWSPFNPTPQFPATEFESNPPVSIYFEQRWNEDCVQRNAGWYGQVRESLWLLGVRLGLGGDPGHPY